MYLLSSILLDKEFSGQKILVEWWVPKKWAVLLASVAASFWSVWLSLIFTSLDPGTNSAGGGIFLLLPHPELQSWDLTAGPIFVQALYPYPHSASPLYQETPIHFHAGIFKRWYSSDRAVKASWNNTAAEVSQMGWQAWLHCSWRKLWASWISDATSTPTDFNVICLYQILLLQCRYPWRVNSNGQSPLQMVICMHTNMRFQLSNKI